MNSPRIVIRAFGSMARRVNPACLDGTAYGTVYRAVNEVVWRDVHQAVYLDVTVTVRGDMARDVCWAMSWAASWAVSGAVDGADRDGHPHPNLDLFLSDIRQLREGETWQQS